MDLKTYQEQAQRTFPDLGFKLNLSHMVLGINSEMNELEDAIDKQDTVNIGEEIADTFWYLANYCVLRNYSLANIHTSGYNMIKRPTGFTVQGNIGSIYNNISKLQDIIKKHIAYDKEMYDDTGHIFFIMWALKDICDDYALDVSIILNNNIEKLKVRYPEKFDKVRAIEENRDLKTERKTLEQ